MIASGYRNAVGYAPNLFIVRRANSASKSSVEHSLTGLYSMTVIT
ncbi:hypothetical protein [Oleidesulfovibrio alaskensis]|nr:hypothetical protein [Oleidesulfovibrio alaskensis]